MDAAAGGAPDAWHPFSRPESVVKKGQTLYTYPLLCFTFENFDELFSKASPPTPPLSSPPR